MYWERSTRGIKKKSSQDKAPRLMTRSTAGNIRHDTRTAQQRKSTTKEVKKKQSPHLGGVAGASPNGNAVFAPADVHGHPADDVARLVENFADAPQHLSQGSAKASGIARTKSRGEVVESNIPEN